MKKKNKPTIIFCWLAIAVLSQSRAAASAGNMLRIDPSQIVGNCYHIEQYGRANRRMSRIEICFLSSDKAKVTSQLFGVDPENAEFEVRWYIDDLKRINFEPIDGADTVSQVCLIKDLTSKEISLSCGWSGTWQRNK